MDLNVWKVLCAAVRSAERRVPRTGRRPLYSDRLIVRMFFWCVAHEQPRCWACARSSYGAAFRVRRLPSVSQFCKRLKCPRIRRMIELVHERLAMIGAEVTLAFFDGKALTVGESSRDADAKSGRVGGKFGRGYRLHALGVQDGRIRGICVRPLNEGEPSTARERLARHIPAGCLVLADGNYDGKELYNAVAARGAMLLTKIKGNERTELAFRRAAPPRKAAMLLWRDEPARAGRIYAQRTQIERIFSALTCSGGGLAQLPPWVRGLDRVTQWITAKVALHNARVLVRINAS